MEFRSTLPLLLVAGLVAACAPADEPAAEEGAEMAMPEGEASADFLADLRSQYEEHYNMGHADMVAALYEEDAVVMFADGSVEMGREAVRGDLAEAIAMSPEVEITGTDRMRFGDVALERGTYEVSMTPEGAEPMSAAGYYLNLVERAEEGWRIAWLATNYETPPAEIPPPSEAEEAATMAEETEVPAGLAELESAYEQHFNLGHADMVADLYTEDAVAMYAESDAATGRAAIASALAERIASGSPQLDIHHAETRMLGDGWAAGRGWVTLTATAEGGEVGREGRYVALYRQGEDGSWKIHWVLTNVDPAPASTM